MKQEPGNVGMKRNKILIADDEADIRDLLSDFLGSEGYECVAAANAFDALEEFKASPGIDLIMSDIRMPGKSGLDLLREIKAIDDDAIVVMISAIKDIESAISAMSRGAYDYVTKPFKLAEVSQIAKKALEKRRLILAVKEYQKGLERMVEERTSELNNANVKLNNALKKLDETYSFTLRALVAALDARDAENQGHSFRVVKYSMELARLLDIKDTGQLKVLEYGALLHDIGKIGISDAILNKKTELSPEEWEVMKRHPVIGYRILHKIEFLEEAAQVVLHHHENYDGTGYPSKLKGEQIPLGSRIFSAADMLDAITSERPYRRAMSFEIASRELKRNSMIQFDPQVVEAFHSVDLSCWVGIKKVSDKDSDSWGIYGMDNTLTL
ncbi:MAG: response regulator [Candidatus Aminicenantes bacterium]|nr:response regulator [Candidatus Aminicenantes bacterium]